MVWPEPANGRPAFFDLSIVNQIKIDIDGILILVAYIMKHFRSSTVTDSPLSTLF